jgi:hypothetical protein
MSVPASESSTMSLDDIPTTAAVPAAARPSDVVARIRSYRPSRRTVLRGLLIAAAASALVPLDWYLSRREAAAAAPSDGGPDDRSEHTTCQPESYREEANNWWSGSPAVCYGGWRRGSYPCADGYHREGSFAARGESYTSTRMTTNCHGRNAWRWNGFRCSDALTTVTFEDGTEYNAVTIAACAIGTSPSDGNDGSTDSDGSGPAERDPSRPRQGSVSDVGPGLR